MTDVAHLTDVRSASVQKNLDALQAVRDVEWTADHLAEHVEYRLKLENEADWSKIIQVGDVIAPFVLDEVDGGTVALAELVRTGITVLIFFRFEECPACNATLPAYRDGLAPELAELGVHLVAISPQVVSRLAPIKSRLGLPFPVASDPDASLIRSLGIAFAPTPEEQVDRLRLGYDNPAVLGNGRWDLPYPTVMVIDQDYVVQFVDAHPNWMVRTDVDVVLDVVRALQK
jgi:peroxiredoxin